ncbi:unnamed protein product [Cuscuta campestris]|uniref:Uncharacterized protein n=1 Tax=Cuscuta campestris TaxID=132261 RepID=A0A484N7Q5_9ASTE|nr:unnamed protein product [Cuscuta campestris]
MQKMLDDFQRERLEAEAKADKLVNDLYRAVELKRSLQSQDQMREINVQKEALEPRTNPEPSNHQVPVLEDSPRPTLPQKPESITTLARATMVMSPESLPSQVPTGIVVHEVEPTEGPDSEPPIQEQKEEEVLPMAINDHILNCVEDTPPEEPVLEEIEPTTYPQDSNVQESKEESIDKEIPSTVEPITTANNPFPHSSVLRSETRTRPTLSPPIQLSGEAERINPRETIMPVKCGDDKPAYPFRDEFGRQSGTAGDCRLFSRHSLEELASTAQGRAKPPVAAAYGGSCQKSREGERESLGAGALALIGEEGMTMGTVGGDSNGQTVDPTAGSVVATVTGLPAGTSWFRRYPQFVGPAPRYHEDGTIPDARILHYGQRQEQGCHLREIKVQIRAPVTSSEERLYYGDGSYLWFDSEEERTRFLTFFSKRVVAPPRIVPERFPELQGYDDLDAQLHQDGLWPFVSRARKEINPALIRAFYSNLRREDDVIYSLVKSTPIDVIPEPGV